MRQFVPSFSRVETQNPSSLPRLIPSIESFNDFYFLNLLFFCSPKRKEAKEKGASRGRLLVRGLKVKNYPQPGVRRTPLSCGVSGAAVIHDGL